MSQDHPWTKSKVTAATVAPFVTARLLSQGNYRIPGDEDMPAPRPGEYVTFVSHLERGFGVPSSLFFRQFLAFYNIKNTDLGPHSIQMIAIYVAFCESYLGCRPYFPLWLALFHGRAHPAGSDNPLQASGGINFQAQPGLGYFNDALPTRAKQPKWREWWLYVKETTPEGELAMPQFNPERSQYRFLRVRKLPEAELINVLALITRMAELKEQGLVTVNLYACWLGRRLVPLRRRDRPMWTYTGVNDPERQLATTLGIEEFGRMLKEITSLTCSDWNVGVAPYHSEDNPSPPVSDTSRLRIPVIPPFFYFLCSLFTSIVTIIRHSTIWWVCLQSPRRISPSSITPRVGSCWMGTIFLFHRRSKPEPQPSQPRLAGPGRN